MLETRVDLVWLQEGGTLPCWPYGKIYSCPPTPGALNREIENIVMEGASPYILFFDSALGQPSPEVVAQILKLPGNLWHAGLRLGLAGKPELLRCIRPLWMLENDPSPDTEAASWRMSFRACLMKSDILSILGGPRSGFTSLESASLEAGYRYMTRGVLMRHTPHLIGTAACTCDTIPLSDQFYFIRLHFRTFWVFWSLWRALARHPFLPWVPFLEYRRIPRETPGRIPADRYPQTPSGKRISANDQIRISVLIPTLDRMSHLIALLSQLSTQTVLPEEIIIIDQSSSPIDPTLLKAGKHTEIVYRYQSDPGQCSSRNLGLSLAKGEYVLLLDDDIRIRDNFIEKHVRNILHFGADVSVGAVVEDENEKIFPEFAILRTADIFPAGNALIRREAIRKSGPFHPAFEKLPRADFDLGMRLYLSGAMMVFDPDIRVLHLRAPRGGLRTHGARKVTFGMSRRSLFYRHLPSASEMYLAMRYFSKDHFKEYILIGISGSLQIQGPFHMKALKICLGILFMPLSLIRVYRSASSARRIIRRFSD